MLLKMDLFAWEATWTKVLTLVYEKQMFLLSVKGRINRSYPYSLCHDKGFMEFIVFPFWCALDAPSSVRKTLLG